MLLINATIFPISCFMIYVCHPFGFPQIQKCIIHNLRLYDDQSSSYCLVKFLSLLPHLTLLKIHFCSFHDDFYKEIADQASLSQVKKIFVNVEEKQKMHNTCLCLFGEVNEVPLSYILKGFHFLLYTFLSA